MLTFIRPGYVGVKVNLFGDTKGIDTKEMTVGMHLVPPWKSVYRFPIFEQNHMWEGKNSFQFQTKDGMAVMAEVGITYRIRPDAVHDIFARYRRGVEEITDTFLRNYCRDAINKAASRYTVAQLYGSEKEHFFADIEQYVHNTLKEIGIEVSRIYLIDRFHFPPSVIEALNKKIEAMQRAEQRENELREAEAEARKQVAASKGRSESYLVEATAKADAVLIEAKSRAEANKLISDSITEYLLVDKAIQQWDGQLPRYFGGPSPALLMGEQ